MISLFLFTAIKLTSVVNSLANIKEHFRVSEGCKMMKVKHELAILSDHQAHEISLCIA